MDDTDKRLIDAKRLEKEAYARFGLESIKFITLIQEQPTAHSLPLHSGEMRNGGTHNTGIENKAGITP